MKRLLFLFTTFLLVTVSSWADEYPIDNYDEPSVDATAPAAEWNAISEGLHCSWANRNVHYMKHRVPQLTETTATTINAWKGERANLEAVLFSKSDQGILSVRMTELKKDGQSTGKWCASARFLNYVITDDGRGCGNHDLPKSNGTARRRVHNDCAVLSRI